MASDNRITTYISAPEEVRSVQDGTAKIQGREVLCIDDLRAATRRIYKALSSNADLALVAGLGLAIRGTSKQYRRVSVPELRELVQQHFILVKTGTGTGGMTRYRVLGDANETPFFWPSVLQGRWITAEVESYFPEIKPPQAKIIQRP